MAKIDECYNQPTGQASAGTTTPAAKVSGDIKNDALGNPGRFDRNNLGSGDSEAHEMAELHELRDKQLGSNGMQSNGFSSKVAEHNTPYPRRGFNQK